LRRVNVDGDAQIRGRVVVLGGGNTAIDCARSALRAGASSVTVAYRRSRLEMPAIHEEVDAAEREGVTFAFLKQPVAFLGNGQLEGVELADVELGPADRSGRRTPMTTDRRASIGCDAVLLALGQSADESVLPEGWSLRDGRAFAAGAPLPVFVAGDLSTGEGTVAHAIGDGRRAALKALAALGDAVAEVVPAPMERSVPRSVMRFDHFPRRPADEGAEHEPAEGMLDFGEVEGGLANASEADRCMSCGHCTNCDNCLVYCPEGVIVRHGAGYAIDLDYCKGCGLCAAECPRGAMEMGAL
jgi:NADPH-dependent glutamate synthase beta subunit-like oxidoreductase